ncbi:unnamed protein product [Notodromas monacha]|uniref:Uncharacterized protein n=1 Tax=Notodromas monacha TaxID=399045 RepID=A0A7R9BLK2_9CRUS|nr:unnamed protein product [Notodromas monacha]CAG0917725.1 unnamed protein product [Notodromas monacha]
MNTDRKINEPRKPNRGETQWETQKPKMQEIVLDNNRFTLDIAFLHSSFPHGSYCCSPGLFFNGQVGGGNLTSKFMMQIEQGTINKSPDEYRYLNATFLSHVLVVWGRSRLFLVQQATSGVDSNLASNWPQCDIPPGQLTAVDFLPPNEDKAAIAESKEEKGRTVFKHKIKMTEEAHKRMEEHIGFVTAVIRVECFINWVAQEIQQWLHSVELAFVLHVQTIFHDTSESCCVLHLVKEHPPTGPNDHIVPVLGNHIETLLNENIRFVTAVIRIKIFINWVAQEIQQRLHPGELVLVLHVNIITHYTSESFCVLQLIKEHPPTGPNDHRVRCIFNTSLRSSQFSLQSRVRLKNFAKVKAFIRMVESPKKKNLLLRFFANLRLRHDSESICGKILSLQCGNSHLRSLFKLPLLWNTLRHFSILSTRLL